MMMLTKQNKQDLPALYSQEHIPNEKKTCPVKFFSPFGRGTWYAIEGQPEEDDFLFYGYVVSPLGSDCDEWGYFTLGQLTSVKGPGGLGIERDMYWDITKPMNEIIKS